MPVRFEKKAVELIQCVCGTPNMTFDGIGDRLAVS